MGEVGVGAYLSLIGREEGWGGCLFEAGPLFEVDSNSRLGAYSNKYGINISKIALFDTK